MSETPNKRVERTGEDARRPLQDVVAAGRSAVRWADLRRLR
jgi:hypothetical protein